MTTYTINPENTIAIQSGAPNSSEGVLAFTNANELASICKDWPLARLAEVWNKLAGATPFDDLKRVKKFTSGEAAISRIWAAVQRLSAYAEKTHAGEPPRSQSKRPTSGKPKPAKAARPKRDEVIALMKRSKGATLAEIVQATGWQKHTVRGFVSVLGSKGGQKVESSKNLAGQRAYRIAK